MKGFLLSILLVSGTPWSLSDCIQYALDHNISIQQSGLSVKQKEIALNTAQNRFLPGVSGGVSQNFSFGRGLTADNTYANTNTTNTSLSLGADMPLFQGLQLVNNVKMSRLDLEAATKDLEKAKDDIRIAVAQAYVQILFNQEILQVARNQVSIDSMQVVRLENMRLNGKASEADVVAQKATLAQSRLTETQSENNLKISILDLTQLLELESPEGFSIITPLTDGVGKEMLMNPEEIYLQAIEEKPSVLAEKIRLDYADRNIAIAKGAFSPTLSLNGGLGTNYYTTSDRPSASFNDQLSNNFSQYIGLSLNVPIFSRMANKNNLKTAQLNYTNQQLQLENVKKTLYKEIQQAYYNAVASQTKLVSSEQAALSAETSFNLTREKYENGKANITEYNESKNRQLEAASNYLQALYECLYQTKLLDFYQGLEIVF